MPDEKKKFKNLTTYAVIMILAVVIIIIIAAMADNREQQFENQINQQQETNMSIQNEIVNLKDENYRLQKEKEELEQASAEAKASLSFYTAMTQGWEYYQQGKMEEAAAKLSEIQRESLSDEEKIHFELLDGLIAAAAQPADNTPQE
ncbi:hypothetical protein [Ructibacterium gallinarum]|uniref:Uncharacterized protein n=1 Tax=Ructibacterium gallinarum TaxID=2779355 RepID=A0A9D5LZ25_9FIRM|nr:hypothetical protein [Ructibacterium gallinarum]MBE5039210.1 hypothetical protein [Ructibacterium gallinarum]